MKDFRERVQESVIVGDGAIGTQFYNKGIPRGHCYDELNLSSPEIVQEIHKNYVLAGAEIIETNTFGANSYVLDKYYGLGGKTKEINELGVKLVKEVCLDQFVAGAIGPITRPYESKEKLSLSEIHSIFSEQVEALLTAGVDILIFETFSDIDELLEGYKVASELGKVPIICQMCYTKDNRTLLGVDAVESAIKLTSFGISILGTNCGNGPQDTYEVISRISRVTDAILSVYPNAGLPTFSHGKFLYSATPEYFAEYAKKYVEIGVSIIGGCCGSTPEHIKAISEAVSFKKPKPRKIVQIDHNLLVNGERKSVQSIVPSSLQKKLDNKFVISVEIDPPRGVCCEKEISTVNKLAEIGVDCLNISDNPMARLRMSPIALANLIGLETGLDVILHCTCRGRNLLTIQSDLLGAFGLGIKNILALTGDPPSIGDYPFASVSYDITSRELIEIIASLNKGVDWLGNPLTSATSFFVGAAGKVDSIEEAIEKVRKGANFIQTQPVFELEKLTSFVKAVKVPVIAGLLPLISLRHAEFIRNELPGVDVSDKIMGRIRNGESRMGTKSGEGIKIAKELLEGIKEICAGVCIMTPFGKNEVVEEILCSTVV